MVADVSAEQGSSVVWPHFSPVWVLPGVHTGGLVDVAQPIWQRALTAASAAAGVH